MRKRLILLLFLTTTAFSSAQISQASSNTGTAPVATFRSRADLVYVPVIVKDKKGRHLSGLTKESFTIEQDGKTVGASIFEEVKNAGSEISQPRVVPGTISNYAAGDERPKRLLIIVLDTLNTPFGNQERAKKDLLKFIETSVPPNEPVAVFSLGRDGLRQLHAFTTNTSLLIAAIKKVRARPGSADDLAVVQPTEPLESPRTEEDVIPVLNVFDFRDFLATVESRSGYNAFQQRQSIRLTLLSFQQLANAFAAIPGRKAVVWATGGFPFSIDDPLAFFGMGLDFAQDYERTWRTLTAANVAVYPIDVLGLINPNWNQQYSAERIAIRTPRSRTVFDHDRLRQDTMRAVANSTGGVACVDTNDLQKCFTQAANDSESYYLLGYYLQGEQKPGWHKLKVKVAGNHGEVRARQGFYTGETPKQLEQRRLQDMYVAVASPVDYTGVHFSIREPRMQRSDNGNTKVTVDVVVPANSFRMVAQQQNQLDLDVLAVALATEGKVASISSHKLEGNPSENSANRIEKEGLRSTETLNLQPGKYVLHVAVRDNQTGQIGTVHTPVEVK